MAVLFPLPPPPLTVGDTVTDTDTGAAWQWDGEKWVVVGGAGGGGASVEVGGTPPTNPKPGNLWWDSIGAQLYLWDGAQWVITVNQPGGGGGGGGAEPPFGPPEMTGTTGSGTTFVLQQAPTINQPRLVGVTDGSDAQPGEIGEYLYTDGDTSAGLNLPVTAGDWDLIATLTTSSDVTGFPFMDRSRFNFSGSGTIQSLANLGFFFTIAFQLSEPVVMPFVMTGRLRCSSAGNLTIVRDVGVDVFNQGCSLSARRMR